MFENIIEQDSAKKILTNFIRSGKLPSSMIFHGPEGIGKFLSARRLARAVQCESKSAENIGRDGCQACEAVDKAEHPDVGILDRKKGPVKIEEVKELIGRMNLRPVRSTRKVFIVNDAEDMNKESANALLKALEEPPSNTHLILVACNLNVLLSTIRSRCIKIRFVNLTSEGVKRILIEKHNVAAELAESIAVLARGNMVNALELADPAKFEVLNNAFNSLVDIWAHDPFNVPKMMETSLLFERSREEERLLFPPLLDMLVFYWRDMMIKTAETHEIRYFLSKALEIRAGRPRVLRILEIIRGIQGSLNNNINLRMAFEYLALEIHRILAEERQG